MKKIFNIVLTVALALMLGIQTYAASDEAREKESAAFDIYMAMLTEWCPDKDNVSDLNAVFPDYYGGSYINDDHDFVIQIVGSVDEAAADLSRFIDTGKVIFEEVRYSWNELNAEADRISAEMRTAGTKAAETVSTVGVDGKNNALLIYTSGDLDGVTDFENVTVVNTAANIAESADGEAQNAPQTGLCLSVICPLAAVIALFMTKERG